VCQQSANYDARKEIPPMSTSLLDHAYGIQGCDYVRTQYGGGKIRFTIRHRSHKLRCAVCNSHDVFRRGQRERMLRQALAGEAGNEDEAKPRAMERER